jgi:hypothetical protein
MTSTPSAPLPFDKKIVFLKLWLWATPPVSTSLPLLDNEVFFRYTIRATPSFKAHFGFVIKQIRVDFSFWSVAPDSLFNDKIVFYVSWMPPASPAPLTVFRNKVLLVNLSRTMTASRSRGWHICFVVITAHWSFR